MDDAAVGKSLQAAAANVSAARHPGPRWDPEDPIEKLASQLLEHQDKAKKADTFGSPIMTKVGEPSTLRQVEMLPGRR